jgi:hypothetical protein
VNYKNVILKNLKKKIEEKEDDKINFDIKVKGDKKKEVKWKKNGEEVKEDGKRIKKYEEGNLKMMVIKNVNSEDEGLFEEEVWNENGWVKEKSEMNVRCENELKKKIDEFEENEGEINVELRINVEDYNKNNIKW